ncbi:type IV toxin-antitoxin system AbiEi family antitoxin domain-containing protein [Acidisoma sp. S159]|uniref:type IV toxin-antitoxin system AbiEi family antitoxin domain-containing protein n=1 Tax=Acidisoma sp. S159 TaxID=1747225 RepID=UPI00352AF7A5
MLRLKDFAAEGIGSETLARLVREEAVVRPARGPYQLPDVQVEADHALAEAAVLVPKGVVCLTSALQYHELTLQMPSAVWMAIEPHCLASQDRLSAYSVRPLHGGSVHRRGRAPSHRERRRPDHGPGEGNYRLLPLPHQGGSRRSDGRAARRSSPPSLQFGSARVVRTKGAGVVGNAFLRRSNCV